MIFKKILWILSTLVLITMAAYYFVSKKEVTASYYETYRELASVSNIFQSGWIPRWLPDTASQIRETHDIDTNETWIAFNFDRNDSFYLKCNRLDRGNVIVPARGDFKRFPRFVAESIENMHEESVVFYNCDKSATHNLAVNKEISRAYVWMTAM